MRERGRGAREGGELKSAGKYPVYFFKSDTTGKKDFEEFYTDKETLDMSRFASLGVIKNGPVFEQEKLAMLVARVKAMRTKGVAQDCEPCSFCLSPFMYRLIVTGSISIHSARLFWVTFCSMSIFLPLPLLLYHIVRQIHGGLAAHELGYEADAAFAAVNGLDQSFKPFERTGGDDDAVVLVKVCVGRFGDSAES